MRAILQKPCFLPWCFFFAFYYIWFGFCRFTPGKASRSRIIKSDTQGGIATKIHQYTGAIIGESPLLFPFESSVCKQKKPISRYLFPLPPICSPPSLPPPPRSSPHIHKQLRGSDTRGDRFRGGRIAVSPSLLPRKKAR